VRKHITLPHRQSKSESTSDKQTVRQSEGKPYATKCASDTRAQETQERKRHKSQAQRKSDTRVNHKRHKRASDTRVKDKTRNHQPSQANRRTRQKELRPLTRQLLCWTAVLDGDQADSSLTTCLASLFSETGENFKLGWIQRDGRKKKNCLLNKSCLGPFFLVVSMPSIFLWTRALCAARAGLIS
jgi:hypothetical protein